MQAKYLMPYLVEDAAIVRIQAALVKKETFLHCVQSATRPAYPLLIYGILRPHTSLKAVDRR